MLNAAVFLHGGASESDVALKCSRVTRLEWLLQSCRIGGIRTSQDGMTGSLRL
jgi:hypothetical protein